MNKHKFLLGNPCGPCEWHIESDVRTYAWFDLIFQAIFVIPVILQLRINIQYEEEFKNGKNNISTNANPPTSTNATVEDNECDDSRIHLAVLYSQLDVVNLSMGMITDILLYAGAKQHNIKVSKAAASIFLICAVVREILHATGLSLHVLRCSPSTYAYEMVVRCLCQYMIYGIWIVIEYLVWLIRGRLFVPQRGQKEPPPEMLEEKETVTTVLTSTTSDFTSNVTPSPSVLVTPPSDHGMVPVKVKEKTESEPVQPEGQQDDANAAVVPKKKKKKKKSKKSIKIDDKPPEGGDGPGKGGSKLNI